MDPNNLQPPNSAQPSTGMTDPLLVNQNVNPEAPLSIGVTASPVEPATLSQNTPPMQTFESNTNSFPQQTDSAQNSQLSDQSTSPASTNPPLSLVDETKPNKFSPLNIFLLIIAVILILTLGYIGYVKLKSNNVVSEEMPVPNVQTTVDLPEPTEASATPALFDDTSATAIPESTNPDQE